MFNRLASDNVNKYTAGTDAPSGNSGIVANPDELGMFIWCNAAVKMYGMVNGVWVEIETMGPDNKTTVLSWSDYQAINAMSTTGQSEVVRMIPVLDSSMTVLNDQQLASVSEIPGFPTVEADSYNKILSISADGELGWSFVSDLF